LPQRCSSAPALGKQIFSISQERVHQEIFLKELVNWRRLGARSFQALAFHDGHLGCPVCAPTDAVHGDSGFVHFWPGLDVVEYTRQHPLRVFAYLDWSLTGAWPIHREKADAVGQDGGKAF